MTSLTVRLVALAALVAVLATALAAWSAGRTAAAALDAHEDQTALLAQSAWNGRLAEISDALDYETRDYAQWSELYQQMPRPDPAWSAINLIPGGHGGAIIGAMAVAEPDGRLTGRYRQGRSSPLGPTAEDPATDREIQAMLSGGPGRGIAWTTGGPVLHVCYPVLTSSGAGPSSGWLLGYAYLDQEAPRRRLSLPGWRQHWAPDVASATITRDEDLAVSFPVSGLPRAMTLARSRDEDRRIRLATVRAVYLTGALAALLAAGLGGILALHWLRPLRQLASDCRALRRPEDLSDGGDLEETRALAAAFKDLLTRQRQTHDDLAGALERTRHLAAIHRAFLTGLSREIGLPVARLAQLLRRPGMTPLAPEEQAEAAALADLLEERLRDAAVIGGHSSGGTTTLGPVSIGPWLTEVADLLRPEAVRAGVQLAIHGSGTAAVPRGVLGPVLIDLLANALRASPAGSTLRLSGDLEVVQTENRQQLVLRVADQGPGLPPATAASLEAAAQRGSVMPGEAGLGLGLSLTIDRLAGLGGRVVLERTGAEGTVIRLEVPLPGPGPA